MSRRTRPTAERIMMESADDRLPRVYRLARRSYFSVSIKKLFSSAVSLPIMVATFFFSR